MAKRDIEYSSNMHEFGAVNPTLELQEIIREQVAEQEDNSQFLPSKDYYASGPVCQDSYKR